MLGFPATLYTFLLLSYLRLEYKASIISAYEASARCASEDFVYITHLPNFQNSILQPRLSTSVLIKWNMYVVPYKSKPLTQIKQIEGMIECFYIFDLTVK